MSVKRIYNTAIKTLAKDIAPPVVLEICVRVKAEAVNLAPVAPVGGGRLKGSIDYRIEGDTGYVGSPVEYAIYQEFGTRYMAPQPFLRPAIAKVVYNQSTQTVLAKRAEEVAKGKLAKGQERVKFF